MTPALPHPPRGAQGKCLMSCAPEGLPHSQSKRPQDDVPWGPGLLKKYVEDQEPLKQRGGL